MSNFKTPKTINVSSTGGRGPAGPAGIGWTSGSGTPTDAAPNGSLYLDQSTLAYYKRIAGVWEVQGSLGGLSPQDTGSSVSDEGGSVVTDEQGAVLEVGL